MPPKKAKLPLSKTHPKLAKEACGWDPKTITAGSSKKLEWSCKKDHRWFAKPNDRTARESGCPYCANKLVSPGFNDLLTTHPKLAKEAHKWNPSLVMSGSTKKLNWKCKNGHVWESTPSSRSRQKTGCLICLGKAIKIGYNDLATTHPLIAKEAHGWDPTKVGAGSNKKLLWICSKGHEWFSVVQSRTSQNTSCLVCQNKQLLSGFNDLETTHPLIAKEAHGWDPTKVGAGSEKKRNWTCNLGHSYQASPKSRTKKPVGTACPYCSGNRVKEGFNDLGTTHPDLSSEAFGWKASQFVAGSHAVKTWICPKRHKWKAQIKSRALNGHGCPVCGNFKVLVGFNDLGTTHPQLAKEAHQWNPKTVVAGSIKKRRWICVEKHIWTASINSRTNRSIRGGSGCPSCAVGGFDPNAKAWIYFGEHKALDLLQIGITNYPETRFKVHKKNDWEITDIRGPMDGHLVQQWETSILKMLRANGAKMGPRKDKIFITSLNKIGDTFIGTESWSKSTFPVKSIVELMRLTEEFEDK